MTNQYYKLVVEKNQFTSEETQEVLYLTPKGVFLCDFEGSLYPMSTPYTTQFRGDARGNIDLTEVADEERHNLIQKLIRF